MFRLMKDFGGVVVLAVVFALLAGSCQMAHGNEAEAAVAVAQAQLQLRQSHKELCLCGVEECICDLTGSCLCGSACFCEKCPGKAAARAKVIEWLKQQQSKRVVKVPTQTFQPMQMFHQQFAQPTFLGKFGGVGMAACAGGR